MTNLMQPRSPVLSPFRSSKLVTPAVSSKKERLIASLALVAGFNLIGYSEDVTKGFPLTLSSDSGSIPQDISRYETMVMSFEIPIDVTNGKFSINLTEKSGEKRSANILAEIDSETIKQIEPTSENYRIATLSVPLRHFPYVFHSWTPYWKDQMAFTKISTQNPVNTEEIESVSFQFSQPNSALQEARILLNSITFTGDLPTEKWVDRFGQNKTVDFTEKIVLDAELIENDKKEIVELTNELKDYVEYIYPKGKYFTLQEVDGVWWFAQPSGDLFWSMGLNCVNVNTGSRLDDVVFKAWEKTPEKPLDLKPGIFSNSGWILNGDGREQYSFFIKNRLIKWRKEEADDKSIHREISRLKAWGFNSVGNWSSTAVQQQGKIPWFSMGPQTSEMKVPLIYKDIHDVYHPDFKKEAIQACKKLSEVSEDPYLVGHFILNEVRWNELVQQILDAKELFTSHARKELINQLQKKYLDIRDLSKAWNSSFDSWKTISFPKGILTPDAETDVAAFRGEFARQWYQIWAESIRHSDPNHLILGSRFDQNNRFPEVLGACGEFCDVVSINHYVQIPNRMEFDNIYKYGKKPIMIGEYGHNSFDKGALTAAIPVSSTQERAIMFSKYTETVASMPFVLGAHYFQYIDEPITGRSDGETGYNGFVSVVDIPWYPMVQAAKQTAKKIESIHKASK